MMEPFYPRIVYNSTTLDLELPVFPWDVRDEGIGGTATAASGVVEAYMVREDSIATVTLRVLEGEIDGVRDWLRFARSSGQTFTFQFSQDDPTTEYTVHLHAPVWPDAVEFARESGYLEMFSTTVELRSVSGAFNTRFTEGDS
jgi:hypothetical protein